MVTPEAAQHPPGSTRLPAFLDFRLLPLGLFVLSDCLAIKLVDKAVTICTVNYPSIQPILPVNCAAATRTFFVLDFGALGFM